MEPAKCELLFVEKIETVSFDVEFFERAAAATLRFCRQ